MRESGYCHIQVIFEETPQSKMTSIFLGIYKYLPVVYKQSSLGTSILEETRASYKKLLNKAKLEADRNPSSDIVLRNLAYYSRGYKAYSRLIHQLKKRPDLIQQVESIVSSTPKLRLQILKLEELGFKLNTFLPGEGVYENPSQQERTEPMLFPVSPKP